MKNKLVLPYALVAAVAITGCNNPADNVPAASVNTGDKEEVEKKSKPGELVSYAIIGGSEINFIGSKAVGGEQPGGFRKFEGTLNVVNDELVAEGSKIVIDMNSIWTGDDKLTAHLKNKDFFNVPEIPTSTFEATDVKEEDGKKLITGDLTMHGVKKSITFPADVDVNETGVTLSAEFHINRFDFDMKYPGQADNLIREEVVLTLNVTAQRAASDAAADAKEKTDAPAEKQADAPAEKKADAPAEKKAAAPAEKKADAPAEKKADAPAKKKG